jgi:hypothetical protein
MKRLALLPLLLLLGFVGACAPAYVDTTYRVGVGTPVYGPVYGTGYYNGGYYRSGGYYRGGPAYRSSVVVAPARPSVIVAPRRYAPTRHVPPPAPTRRGRPWR